MPGDSASGGTTAGVVAPPPLLLAAALIAGFVLEWLLPSVVLPSLPPLPRYAACAILTAAALAIALVGSRAFTKAGTPVEPWRPSTVLVTSGVFAHVRNPIYLGFILLMLSVALGAGSDWVAIATAGLAFTLHFGVVLREERYLEAAFGEEYRRYKRRVPRYGWRF